MVQSSDFAEIRNQVLTDNTAQSVLNHLKELEDNRAHVLTRWVWELLQNARDASVNSDGKLVASIVQNENEIVFRHNGDNFKMEEIAHLIYHGSTKVETEETIGQYGSGFLTTHLLSPEIKVSGQLEDGRSFSFQLRREISSVNELSKSMRNAEDAFVNSLYLSPTPETFSAEFCYPLRGDALKVVEAGIEKLKQCAPLVLAFNSQFATINIETPSGVIVVNEIGRKELQQSGIEQITVSETADGNKRVRQYLVAHGDNMSVAIPVESIDDEQECLQVENTPRLFLGFPLIGTEKFSFPAVINSFRFTPTKERDGVFLWQSGEVENAANQENQAVLEEACGLLADMLQFAASSGWRNAYRLTNVPSIEGQRWLDVEKLRDCLKESLIERVRQTPAVLNESGEAIPPKESEIPIANMPEGVTSLWDLLIEWQEDGDIWPRRDEAAGWCDAVKSWARLSDSDSDPLTFNEVIDGRKLASIVDSTSHDRLADPRTHRVSLLANSLKGNIPAINWLDQLISFLRANGQGDAVSEYRIVPSQAGFLRKLTKLHRDVGISEELKTVAGLLEWRIKPELRDTRITALSEEVGLGDWDNDYVVGELIRRLRDRAETPDAAFAEASVQLFTWIVEQQKWDLLRGFPVFGRRSDPERPLTVIHLPINDQSGDRPMSPVKVWTEDLQPFADLFPFARILADAFFDALPEPSSWQMLAERLLVGTGIIISGNAIISKFYPDFSSPQEGEEHSTVDLVPVTDVWRLADIIERVRDSQDRARLFWRFLTEWLAPKDLKSLEAEQAHCSQCGATHRYYPAAWIEQVREKSWVRQGNDVRTLATAQSLATLLRSSQWDPNSLGENPAAVKLLEAMGISHFELLRELLATNDENRHEVNSALINILASAGNNVTRLNQAQQYIEDLKFDEALPSVLAERREQRRRVHENQQLGDIVEALVKEGLESEGFTVERTGTGSDFRIEYDDVAKLELAKSGKTWLVEVKATRGQGVRITATQARTAVEEGAGYLVCVVPVEGDTTDLKLDDVRGNMRFVQNIGPRVAQLCSDLDGLNELRNDITADAFQGVQLEVDSGAARVRVSSSVWQDDGFPLAELPNHLN